MVKRKVAIYARVSTEHKEQLSALENQVQYYDNILNQHPDWELYDRYIDEGITGTSVKKRKNFMRMMADAEASKFSLIITREVSRFARNTVDTLQETRKLKKIGVEVWFTEDNIWTMNDEDGELRLTIMATLAQNESKKISMRVKAGQMVSFKNAVPYGNGNILGYDKLPNHGGYVINQEQADTVRMIYDMYLSGMGEMSIKYELEKRGRLTSMGKSIWYCANIGKILNNAFYCGVVVYRKQYVPDYLEQKKINNFGEIENVIVDGTHEPIISKEVFYEVQKRLGARRQARKDEHGMVGYTPSDNIWVRKLICQCGCTYNKKATHRRKDGTKGFSFQCYSQVRTGSVSTRANKGLNTAGICTTQMIQEWKLDMMANIICATICSDKKKILEIATSLLERNIQNEIDTQLVADRKELQNRIERVKRKISNLLDMRLNGDISKDEYFDTREHLDNELDSLERRIQEMDTKEMISPEDIKAKLEILRCSLENDFKFENFRVSEEIIEAIINKVVVYDDHLEWYLNFSGAEPIDCRVTGRPSKAEIYIAEQIEDSIDHSSTYKQYRQLLPISNAIT